MFDGLRNDASNTSGFDEQVEYFPDDKLAAPRRTTRKSSRRWLGLTAQQRFIISVMLMFAVCALGAMCLLITERFVIPLY